MGADRDTERPRNKPRGRPSPPPPLLQVGSELRGLPGLGPSRRQEKGTLRSVCSWPPAGPPPRPRPALCSPSSPSPRRSLCMAMNWNLSTMRSMPISCQQILGATCRNTMAKTQPRNSLGPGWMVKTRLSEEGAGGAGSQSRNRVRGGHQAQTSL